MSMKSMSMLLGMSLMMAGAESMEFGGRGKVGKRSNSPRKPEQKNFTPEQMEKFKEQAKEKFLLDLNKNNIDRKLNFPRWKEYEVEGFVIVASNQKNAFGDLTRLLKSNGVINIIKDSFF